MKELPGTVLAYIEKDDSYLMLFRNKKEKDINANKWIGVGGHIEQDETVEQALYRESDTLPPLKEVGASCSMIPTDQA